MRRRRSGCPTPPSTTTTARRRTRVGASRSSRRRRRLADEWRQARGISTPHAGDPGLVEMAPEFEDTVRRLEEELALALVIEKADEKDVIVEVRQGVGGGRGGALGGRRPAHAHPLRRADGLQDRDAVDERERGRWPEGVGVRREGPGRVLDLQVRGRHASCPAGPRDGVARSHPHLHGDGRSHARGGGGRGADPRERPARRRHALHRARAARA